MKWFWKWAFNKLRNANDDDGDVPIKMGRATISGRDIDADEGLNITVRSAMGGKIVSFRHYDHKTDRHYTKLYVIPEDLDFERELGKMITMESMR